MTTEEPIGYDGGIETMTTRLSESQKKAIRSVSATKSGFVDQYLCVRFGHSDAGRQSSAWWRTWRSLVRLGLAVQLTERGEDYIRKLDRFALTEAGRLEASKLAGNDS